MFKLDPKVSWGNVLTIFSFFVASGVMASNFQAELTEMRTENKALKESVHKTVADQKELKEDIYRVMGDMRQDMREIRNVIIKQSGR